MFTAGKLWWGRDGSGELCMGLVWQLWRCGSVLGSVVLGKLGSCTERQLWRVTVAFVVERYGLLCCGSLGMSSSGPDSEGAVGQAGLVQDGYRMLCIGKFSPERLVEMRRRKVC